MFTALIYPVRGAKRMLYACAVTLALCSIAIVTVAYAQPVLTFDQALRLAQDRSRQLVAQDYAAASARDGHAQVLHEGLSILLRVMSPITPHIAHVLWKELGFEGDPLMATWPEVDESALETDEIELVLQVNGKLRGHMRAPKSADRAAIERLALENDAVRRHTNGQPPKKVVVVPGRLVNVVV